MTDVFHVPPSGIVGQLSPATANHLDNDPAGLQFRYETSADVSRASDNEYFHSSSFRLVFALHRLPALVNPGVVRYYLTPLVVERVFANRRYRTWNIER